LLSPKTPSRSACVIPTGKKVGARTTFNTSTLLALVQRVPSRSAFWVVPTPPSVQSDWKSRVPPGGGGGGAACVVAVAVFE
jgi:hypothetical protein